MQNDPTFLTDMLLAARQVTSYLEDQTLEMLIEDTIRRDAVILQIIILGEAARNVSSIYQEEHPEIPWSSIIGMRNMLVHQYFRTDIEVVWDTVKQDLPQLIKSLIPLVPSDAIADDDPAED